MLNCSKLFAQCTVKYAGKAHGGSTSRRMDPCKYPRTLSCPCQFAFHDDSEVAITCIGSNGNISVCARPYLVVLSISHSHSTKVNRRLTPPRMARNSLLRTLSHLQANPLRDRPMSRRARGRRLGNSVCNARYSFLLCPVDIDKRSREQCYVVYYMYTGHSVARPLQP